MMEKINKSSLSGLNDKIILSTSKDDKKIFLWDENTGSVTYTYEDQNTKNYISKLLILGKDLYSEFIISLQENKSLLTFYKTNASEPFLKCNPIDERITCIDTSDDSKYLFISTENGNFFIYEIFSGNLLTSSQISSEKILDFKPCLKNSSGFLFICQDYVKFFLLENILDKININSFFNSAENNKDSDFSYYSIENNSNNLNPSPYREFPNTDKFHSLMLYGFPTSHVFLYSKNKINVKNYFLKSYYLGL